MYKQPTYNPAGIRCICVLLLAFIFLQEASAQIGRSVAFSYQIDNQRYTGSFNIWIGQTNNGDLFRDVSTIDNPVLNYNNMKSGGLRMVFSDLKWDSDIHIRNELHLDWHKANLPSEVRITNPATLVLGIDARQQADLLAVGNGAVDLELPFKVYYARAETVADQFSVKLGFIFTNVADDEKLAARPVDINVEANRAWRQINVRDIQALEAFEKEFKGSNAALHAEELRAQLKEFPWDHIAAQRNPGVMRSIIYQYPNYPYHAEVQQLLEQSDKEMFEQARSENTPAAYRRYLEAFPDGRYVARANEAIRNLGEQISSEEEAWSAALAERTVSSITTFIRDWPESRFLVNAQQMLSQLTSLDALITTREKTNRGERFVVKFENATSRLSVDAVSGNSASGIEFQWLDPVTLEVMILDNITRTMYFRGANGAETSIVLDVTTEALFVQFDRSLSSLNLHILGGKPPYEAHFYPEGKNYPVYSTIISETTSEDAYEILFADLPASMQGTFTLQVRDSRKTEVVEFEGIVLHAQATRSYGLYTILATIAGMFVLLYLFRVIRRARLKANERAVQRKIEQRRQQQPHSQAGAAPQNVIHQKPVINRAQAHTEADFAAKNSGIVIKANRKAKIRLTEKDRSSMNMDIGDDFVVLDLNTLWGDTIVGKVHLGHGMISDLHQFLDENQWQLAAGQTSPSIPEVGGFLLGNYMMNDETGQYILNINTFVPVTPEKNDVYKIEFGTAAWTELADVQDEYGHLNTIGWFHTHPGHGLFLSMPDLRIQKGFFGLPYQIAMEIDPLSGNIDMAIFTQKNNGEINNAADRNSQVGWYRWNDIIQQVQEQ